MRGCYTRNKKDFCLKDKNFHDCLEREARRALQGECMAQRRLSGFEMEMDRKSWERRNSDMALFETSRHLESQQLELGLVKLRWKAEERPMYRSGGLFMLSTMNAAIHLGPNYSENLEVYKNTNFEEIPNLFGITQKLILDLSDEIANVKPLESTAPSWTRSTLSDDQVIKWTKSRITGNRWRTD